MTRLFDKYHCCANCSDSPTLRPRGGDEDGGARYLILLSWRPRVDFWGGSFFGGGEWNRTVVRRTAVIGGMWLFSRYGLRIRGTVLAELGPDCGFSAMG